MEITTIHTVLMYIINIYIYMVIMRRNLRILALTGQIFYYF